MRINLPVSSVVHPVDVVSKDIEGIKQSFDLAQRVIRFLYISLQGQGLLISISRTEDTLYIDPKRGEGYPGWDGAFGFTVMTDRRLTNRSDQIWDIRMLRRRGAWTINVSSSQGVTASKESLNVLEKDITKVTLKMVRAVERSSRIFKPRGRKAKAA